MSSDSRQTDSVPPVKPESLLEPLSSSSGELSSPPPPRRPADKRGHPDIRRKAPERGHNRDRRDRLE